MYIQQDAATKCKDLLLYSVYAMAGTTTKDWVDAFETVRRWGLAHGCKRIVGYTNNPSIMRVLQNFETEIWTYVMVNFVHQMDKEEE